MPDQPASTPAEPFETLYERMISILRFVSHVRFGVPLADAEDIVHGAFVKYIRDYSGVRDPGSWLVTVVANASRNYLRDNRKETALPFNAERIWADPNASRLADVIATRLALGAAFRKLDAGCREVLNRFHERGESTEAIAHALGTTSGYVQLRLHLCRKRVRAIYLDLTRVRS
ncbi:MAG: Sigma-70 region 2 [Acidobacteriota bacterium]|jgi:RNA polymerase sigma factor (sigma-70 family)|nr:Sigma-70 region 2 [Acidobacteriota bacterium]